ncbi:AraC family transcriptional regulator [Sphingobacterium deserti]|uniref:Transcriptional regulator, AraC family n=1 Tax=Sphingobacterium deserti TaxID=1229276 RepID=A0A0B8T738_9SPHI|nr:AraC family transcriptional regulator [Sphingobacterium deserti]KGE13400.1 transcriptional regulator, AraC family [Sphingobacterium deserti]
MERLTLKQFYDTMLLKALFFSLPDQESQKGFQHKSISNAVVDGIMQHCHCDQFVVCYQEWSIKKPFSLLVEHPEHMVKFQFELEGSSLFTDEEGKQIPIPSGHQQFIYLPTTKGSLYYPLSRKVLDIHIEFDFLLAFLREQGFSRTQLKEHFLVNSWTFFREAIPITFEQQTLIRELLAHSFEGAFAKDYIRCKAMEIMLSVFSEKVDTVSRISWKSQDLHILQQIRSYLDQNFAKDLQFKTICRTFGINEFKLKKAFKECYGDTVFGYIRKARLKHALHLLVDTDMDIKEVSYICGFKYPHHFSQLFFQHYRCRPREARSKTGVIV